MQSAIIFVLLVCNVQAKVLLPSAQQYADGMLANEFDKLSALDDDSLIADLFEYYQMQYHPERSMSRSDPGDNIRMNNFKETLKFITETNSAEKNTFKVGLNQFSDWTHEELAHHTGFIPDDDANTFLRFGDDPIPDTETLFPWNDEIDDSWDWTAKRVVTSPKHQGQCGSCYAFAFVGLLESNYAIRYGASSGISEQQFVDCAPNFGCNGGNFFRCFTYMESKLWYFSQRRIIHMQPVLNHA